MVMVSVQYRDNITVKQHCCELCVLLRVVLCLLLRVVLCVLLRVVLCVLLWVVLCVLLPSSVYLSYYVCIAVFTLDAGLLAISQYSEGPATGHLDTGFSWFPCVYKQMLRWFPRFQVTTTCFSCSPPDLNLLVTTRLVHQPMHTHKIVYIKTFKIAPTCFDHAIIIRELRCSLLELRY